MDPIVFSLANGTVVHLPLLKWGNYLADNRIMGYEGAGMVPVSFQAAMPCIEEVNGESRLPLPYFFVR